MGSEAYKVSQGMGENIGRWVFQKEFTKLPTQTSIPGLRRGLCK